MFPLLPADNLAAAFELVYCFATAITVIASYLLTMRV